LNETVQDSHKCVEDPPWDTRRCASARVNCVAARGGPFEVCRPPMKRGESLLKDSGLSRGIF